MPKWQKGAKEFVVSINYNESRGTQCNIPKPILELLDHPEKLKFIITGKNIKINAE